ncbi:MAG: hypothetical protein Q9169_007439 [Polycauliona sp. 2 TL-2023]
MKGRQLRLSSFRNPKPSLSNPPSRYICQQCRHRASLPPPAISPTIFPIPFNRRTYATEPTIPDKFQAYFNEKIGKRLFKDGQIPGAPREDDAKQPDEEPAYPPARDIVVDDSDYKPATSGEELEAVGGPSGWWEKAWDEAYQFKGWMRPTPMTDGKEIKQAIERALVEWYTVEKGSIKFRETVGAANRLWAQNRSWEFSPVKGFSLEQKDNGKVQLRWKRAKDREEMQTWLMETFRNDADTTVLGESMLAEEAEGEDIETTGIASEKEVNNQEIEEGTRAEDTDARAKAETDMATAESGLRPDSKRKQPKARDRPSQKIEFKGLQGSLSLHNHNLKFTVIKRVMQLTGIRIPDTTIQSITSSLHLWHTLIAKPAPPKLAQLLLQGHDPTGRKPADQKPLLAHLPNVQVLATKLAPEMKERGLGRQKVIEQQLGEYGIEVPFGEEMEQIRIFEEERLRRGIDAMVEEREEDGADRWREMPIEVEDGGEHGEVVKRF